MFHFTISATDTVWGQLPLLYFNDHSHWTALLPEAVKSLQTHSRGLGGGWDLQRKLAQRQVGERPEGDNKASSSC